LAGDQDLAVDASGNVYVSGLKATRTQTNSIIQAALVMKFDSSGQILWEQPFGGSNGTTIAENITLGSDGRIYLTGWTEGSLWGTNSGGQDTWYGVFSNDAGTNITSLQSATVTPASVLSKENSSVISVADSSLIAAKKHDVQEVEVSDYPFISQVLVTKIDELQGNANYYLDPFTGSPLNALNQIGKRK
jgi:hypothetical protein